MLRFRRFHRRSALLLAFAVLLAGPGFAWGPRPGPGPGFRRRPSYGSARWYGGRPWGRGPRTVVGVLPLGRRAFFFHGARWYFWGGFWYRPFGVNFILDFPPVGLLVPLLPIGYGTCVYGGITYYTANDVYYTAVPGGYQVAAPPPGSQPTPPDNGYAPGY